MYIEVMQTILHALAEEHRYQIVELLSAGPQSVGEITDKLGYDQPKVSKHLRILSDTGLVESRPMGNKRIYRLRPDSFRELEAWAESYRRLTDESFDRMEELMNNLQGKELSEKANLLPKNRVSSSKPIEADK
ncbi:ArsR/SmtB family transcription factor [Bacillus sp. V3-13]|uniref:ArsR/SmtB family transcription factor n=1 Tax=Bacillus sp. V3-13 TaxID=2053728 RepID=UPI0026A7712A